MTVTPEAISRLYFGVTYLATTLSRTSLKMEEQLHVHAGAGIKAAMYGMIAEASKLLPLFASHAETLFVTVEPSSTLHSGTNPADARQNDQMLAHCPARALSSLYTAMSSGAEM